MKVGREPVVRAGLELLNESGLDGLTLKGIATKLGVQAPTLYWRFKNKQDLIDEMATQVLADWVAVHAAHPSLPNWQEQTLAFGQGLYRALLRYRDGARMVAGSYLTDNHLYAPMEAMLQTYAAAGIAPEDAMACLATIYSYVIGFTIEQQAVISPKGERDPRYDLAAREVRVDVEHNPLASRVGPLIFDNYDARLERGLRMIVAGFAVELDAAAL
jgi:TetR/AcrR family tetracycline transcriptional repressor